MDKVLDWSKIPTGTRVLAWWDGPGDRKTACRLFAFSEQWERKFDCAVEVDVSVEICELAEQTEFTYWPGGECPLPDGVMVEVVYRDGEKDFGTADLLYWEHEFSFEDVIAYRILGLAEGWKYPHEVEND